jgi:uncharacterized protein YbjT (DUF2867 family)
MMDTVLVTGGTGQLGQQLVPLLLAAGHPVRIASRATAPEGTSNVDWATVDYRSGSGLPAALSGVATVLHCASGSPKGERETIAALVTAARAQPAPPLIVYISIVGVDRIPLSYYAAKVATERALIESGLPYTILRATQFHSLIAGLLRGLARLPVMLLPKGIRFQPIGIPVVAARLAELAAGDPRGRVDDIGGPAVRTLPELAAAYFAVTGKPKPIVQVPLPGRLIAAMRAGANLTPEHAVSGQSFEEYLAAHT